MKYLPIFFLLAGMVFSPPTSVSAQTAADWHMARGNPERTNWVTEEVRGNLGGGVVPAD